MKKVGDYYQVQVRLSKETTQELLTWLEDLGHEIERADSTLETEPKTIQNLIKQCDEHTGNAPFILELNFKNQESAVLAMLKFGS